MNLAQLWDKCLYCLLCKDRCREIEISFGPDKVFRYDASYVKFADNHLRLYTNYLWKQTHLDIQFDINCSNDTFVFTARDEITPISQEEFGSQKVKKSDPFFWLDANCPHCHGASVHSTDIELSLKTNQLKNVGVEKEWVKLANYEVIFYPDEMIVAKENGGAVSFPPMELDLADPQKALEQVKTMLVFG